MWPSFINNTERAAVPSRRASSRPPYFSSSHWPSASRRPSCSYKHCIAYIAFLLIYTTLSDPVVTLWPLGAFIHQQYWATSQTLSTSLLSPAIFLFFALAFSLASAFVFGEWRMLLRDDIDEQFMLNACVFATYSQLLLLIVHLLTPCYPLPGGVFFSRYDLVHPVDCFFYHGAF